jgi:hypothetical protein
MLRTENGIPSISSKGTYKAAPFADETFDLIFHPVSNSYIEDVQFVWMNVSEF